MNLFDTGFDRRSAGSVKWNRYPKDVLPMWVADMDFLPPPFLRETLSARVQTGEYGYPADYTSAREALAGWLNKRHNWHISEESILFLPSVVSGFNLAVRTSAGPGEGVIVQQPAYRPFFQVAGHHDCLEQRHTLHPDASGKYLIDFQALERLITPQSRVFLLCNPHNPSGRVFTSSELEMLAEICLKNKLLICSDEIHSDLIYKGHKHIPIASLDPKIADSTITLLSPSKTFNLAGLKAAAAVIPNSDLRARFLQSRSGLLSRPNVLGMAALEAAYRSGEGWLESLLSYLSENLLLLASRIETCLPGIKFYPPEGTFLAWLDFRASGIPDPYQFLLDRARVAVNPGTWFGPAGKGFVRLNFGCPRPVLEEGLERICSAVTSNTD